MYYLASNWSHLEFYVEAGYLLIETTPLKERSSRLSSDVRRLFSDTTHGDSAGAQIYSLIETAKVNGQGPYSWLRPILERLRHASSVEDYEGLLPWNCSSEMR